jgi:hypothetical protein
LAGAAEDPEKPVNFKQCEKHLSEGKLTQLQCTNGKLNLKAGMIDIK